MPQQWACVFDVRGCNWGLFSTSCFLPCCSGRIEELQAQLESAGSDNRELSSYNAGMKVIKQALADEVAALKTAATASSERLGQLTAQVGDLNARTLTTPPHAVVSCRDRSVRLCVCVAAWLCSDACAL